MYVAVPTATSVSTTTQRTVPTQAFTSLKDYNKKKLQQDKRKVITKTKYSKNKVRQESTSDKRRWKPEKRPNGPVPYVSSSLGKKDFSKEREKKRNEMKFVKGNWRPVMRNMVKRRRKPPPATSTGRRGGGYYSHHHQVTMI